MRKDKVKIGMKVRQKPENGNQEWLVVGIDRRTRVLHLETSAGISQDRPIEYAADLEPIGPVETKTEVFVNVMAKRIFRPECPDDPETMEGPDSYIGETRISDMTASGAVRVARKYMKTHPEVIDLSLIIDIVRPQPPDGT
jgi:hypothetical protein